MTQEEKAEAYSKAVEKAKQEYSITTSEDRKQWLEELFPELRESEDERIRKEILNYIDKATGCKRWVAWLEKQGEQKSFDYENANIPQKDSTWGEEDKHWLQKVIDFMNHPDLIKATPTLAKDTINWLKSLKDRVQPQSKQEWSEEDESNFQGIIDVIKENKHHTTDYEHMTYYKLLSWFKSLKNRYVWKPSDEQMKALDWALSLAKNCGDECAFDLRTLQEQLKKI